MNVPPWIKEVALPIVLALIASGGFMQGCQAKQESIEANAEAQVATMKANAAMEISEEKSDSLQWALSQIRSLRRDMRALSRTVGRSEVVAMKRGRKQLAPEAEVVEKRNPVTRAVAGIGNGLRKLWPFGGA